MALTLTEANRMVQAAVAKAQERNVKISVAMCDTGGTLLAFHRMEGASAVRGCLETKPLYEKRLCHIQGKAKNGLTG